VLLSNAANIANILNLVSYLRNEMHMDVARASTMASNFFAALQMFSIPAAFLADSYIKRFYTILIFGPIEILVQVLLHFFPKDIYLEFCFAFKEQVGLKTKNFFKIN
jgi:peptide/histidine transporter 3/4